jgi:hypothetical protein
MKPVLINAMLAGCALLCNAAPEEQATPKAPDKAPDQAAAPVRTPLVVKNPDGTFTVQKVPVGKDNAPGARKGLIIPPQVVIPIVPAKK